MGTEAGKRQVAIPHAMETDVFVNENMEITIKQVGMYGEEAFVWFSASNARSIVDAINRAVREIEEDQS